MFHVNFELLLEANIDTNSSQYRRPELEKMCINDDRLEVVLSYGSNIIEVFIDFLQVLIFMRRLLNFHLDEANIK